MNLHIKGYEVIEANAKDVCGFEKWLNGNPHLSLGHVIIYTWPVNGKSFFEDWKGEW